jgi:hypothetical protein
MSTLQSEIVVPSPSAVRWDVGGTARLGCDPPSTDAMSLSGVARSRGPAGQPAPNRPADEVNLAPAGHVIAHVEVDGMVR